MIKIQIPLNTVCSEHTFLVFIDPGGTVRGYELIDICFSSYLEGEIEEEVEGKEISIRALILNFGLYGLIHLLHAKLFNYPIYILSDSGNKLKANEIDKFFGEFISNVHSENPIIEFIEEKKNYGKIKLKKKEALLLDFDHKILQTPWKGKLKFEKEIMERACEILDNEDQTTLIKQYIDKFIEEVKYVEHLLADVSEIDYSDLVKDLSKKFDSKNVEKRLDLIKEYISRRISAKILDKIKDKVVSNLQKALW